MKRHYSEFVDVSPRFSRSVNLERDLNTPGAVDGYILTATSMDMLNRMATALKSPGRHKAWTLTGPYGSGKSAFCLFSACLFGNPQDSSVKLSRQLLRDKAPDLYQEFFDQRRIGSISRDGFVPPELCIV